MNETGSPIHNISDTARWAAFYRAKESERPDALFHSEVTSRVHGLRFDAGATGLVSSSRKSARDRIPSKLRSLFRASMS